MTESRLRDLINQPRLSAALRKDARRWNVICAAMDAIGDTQLAINDYLDGKLKTSSHGTVYIVIYGVLQLLFVQQDALRNLAKEVGIPFTLPQALLDIREIRNASVGHPTSHGGQYSSAINRNAMSSGGFDLFQYSAAGELNVIHIRLSEIALEQKALIDNLLGGAVNRLEEDERNHRATWRNDPILPRFSAGLNYLFKELSEGVLADSLMGRIGLEALNARLQLFNSAIADRGLEGALSGVVGTLNELRYPLDKLEHHFRDGGQRLSAEDGRIIVHYVRSKFSELEEMAAEIDQDYKSDSVD